jgi:protein TonB
MEAHAISKADYLDILFDNRNKQYGGYELRSHYQQRVIKSMGIVYAVIAALVIYACIPHGKGNGATPDVTHRITELTDIIIPSVVLPPPKIEPPAASSTVAYSVPVVVVDNLVTTPPPAIDVVSTLPPGISTTTGDPNATTTASTTGTGHTTVAQPTTLPPATWVEEMPAFDGDITAYLQKAIRYPDAARESNIEGRVTVRFVVNEDGSVTNAQVMKGIGGGCNEEALRVINSMPKWKPGKQGGHLVKVYYTIPISFLLQ